MTLRSVIRGTGSALPARRVDNAEMAQMVDTSDEWIVSRTGIRSRYIAGEGETTATLATDAARAALAAAGVDASGPGFLCKSSAAIKAKIKQFAGLPLSWIPTTWVYKGGDLRYALNYGEIRFPVLQQFLADSESEWSHKGEPKLEE